MKLKLLAVAALSVSICAAQAHSPEKGKNGGQQADAGEYHVEAVVKDKSLTVYISDHNDKAIPTGGFKGTAILVVNGKTERIALSPDAGNRLSGTATVDLKSPIKGAIRIVTGANATVQAKF